MLPVPVIDPDAITGLRALSPDDGDAFLKEILTIFLQDTPVRIRELHTSLKDGETELFVRSAHSIKGSASNVGAAQLRDAAERIEHHARKTGTAGTGEMIVELEAAFVRARTALEKLLAAV
jgi:HPt (histidine-containing phosphotransfer) domain-containing protein